MPLIGKRLKPKDLKTLSLTMASREAKPVRMFRANKKRIIFGRLVEVLTRFSRAPPNAAKMSDRCGPHCWRPGPAAVRHLRCRAGYSANKALETRRDSVAARRAGQTRISGCRIRPLHGPDRCPLKWRALGLSSLQSQLILAWDAG